MGIPLQRLELHSAAEQVGCPDLHHTVSDRAGVLASVGLGQGPSITRRRRLLVIRIVTWSVITSGSANGILSAR